MIVGCSTGDEAMSSRNDGVHEIHVYESRHTFTYLAVVTTFFNPFFSSVVNSSQVFNRHAVILRQVLRSQLVRQSISAFGFRNNDSFLFCFQCYPQLLLRGSHTSTFPFFALFCLIYGTLWELRRFAAGHFSIFI